MTKPTPPTAATCQSKAATILTAMPSRGEGYLVKLYIASTQNGTQWENHPALLLSPGQGLKLEIQKHKVLCRITDRRRKKS